MIKACTGIFMFGQHPGLQKGKHVYFSFRKEMMDVSSACGSGKSIGGKMLEPENGSESYIFSFT